MPNPIELIRQAKEIEREKTNKNYIYVPINRTLSIFWQPKTFTTFYDKGNPKRSQHSTSNIIFFKMKSTSNIILYNLHYSFHNLHKLKFILLIKFKFYCRVVFFYQINSSTTILKVSLPLFV